MDLFAVLAADDLEALGAALDSDPLLARTRNAQGASLLSVAVYMGKAAAIPLIRAALLAIDAHEAIILGDAGRLRSLLDSGFDGNSYSADGFPPLALAAFFKSAEAFELLLPLTRDVDARANNPQRVAAIHAATAVRDARTVEKLLRAGADPNLEQAGSIRPLHVAAEHGDALTVGVLLLFGADPTLSTAEGRNAMEHAQRGGHEGLAKRLRQFC